VEFAANGLDGFGEVRRRRRARAHEGVTQPYGAPQRLGCASTEPDRRVRALYRLGLDSQAVDVAECSVERDGGLVGPRRLHQLEALGEIADERRLFHA